MQQCSVGVGAAGFALLAVIALGTLPNSSPSLAPSGIASGTMPLQAAAAEVRTAASGQVKRTARQPSSRARSSRSSSRRSEQRSSFRLNANQQEETRQLAAVNPRSNSGAASARLRQGAQVLVQNDGAEGQASPPLSGTTGTEPTDPAATGTGEAGTPAADPDAGVDGEQIASVDPPVVAEPVPATRETDPTTATVEPSPAEPAVTPDPTVPPPDTVVTPPAEPPAAAPPPVPEPIPLVEPPPPPEPAVVPEPPVLDTGPPPDDDGGGVPLTPEEEALLGALLAELG